jgi:hypothetical protein
MRIRLLMLATLLVAVSCSGDDDATSTSSPAPTTTAEALTTTAPEATTSSSSTTDAPTTSVPETSRRTTPTQPPTTVRGSVDWANVAQTLGQRRQDLYAVPDVSRIPQVCAENSQCAEQLTVQIGDLASKGWHVEGADPYIVLDATVERFDGSTLEDSLLVTVVALLQRQEESGTIVDSSGAVVADVENETRPGFNPRGRFLLGRVGPADDPWRFVSQDTLPEVPA